MGNFHSSRVTYFVFKDTATSANFQHLSSLKTQQRQQIVSYFQDLERVASEEDGDP